MLKIDKDEPIDAALEIKRHNVEHRNSIKGERAAPNLGVQHSALPLGSKTFLIIIFICACAIAGVFIWKAWHVKQALQNSATSDNNLPISNHFPHLTFPDPDDSPELNEEIGISEVPMAEVVGSTPQQTSLKRRLSSSLISKDTKASDTSGQIQPQIQSHSDNLKQDSFKGSEGELQSKLKPLHLNPSAAGVLGDRDYLLTQGAMIDCQLETRLVTTQPGMTSCYVTRNIYSANGRVVLIDRGSKVVGHYQGGIVQGQASIFVLWTRVETPKGVIINLDSPATDPLGESGMSGYIDTHFWQRFGGAIMMSFIGDLGDFAARQGRQNKGNTIQFNNTSQGMQDAAVEALRNSINIPPTLYKNQGERVSIFVARDLDFGGVYELESK